jgi:NTP pyrophosphatase (non-canonical NTP hydrolase)
MDSKYKKPWEGKRMELNEYQEQALKTANYHGCLHDSNLEAIIYCSLGLAGEAGEVVENTKKLLRDDNSEYTESRKKKFLGELGDVLWYLANLSNALGYTLEEVAEYNICKLEKRHAKGK